MVPVTTMDLSDIRFTDPDDPHGPTTRYPAIALPDGPKDRLVLPEEHLWFFQDALIRAAEIDLLVLGYSALDTEVLGLIKEAGCTIRRLTIVNANPESNLEVYDRIAAFGVTAIWSDTYDGSYAEWIDGDGLRRWVTEYDGPFISATEPDELRRRIDVRHAEQRIHQEQARRDSILNRPM
jgi:hypothetical protein